MKILDFSIGRVRRFLARSTTRAHGRRLLVDVSVIYQSDVHTGIQRVVRGVLENIRPALSGCVELVPIAATSRDGYRVVQIDFLKQAQRQSLRDLPRLRRPGKGDVFLALDLAAHIQPRHKRTLLNWKRRGCEFAVVVYDLIPICHPEWFSDKLVKDFRKWIDLHVSLSDRFLCISEWVASELGRYIDGAGVLRQPGQIISSFMLGADLVGSLPTTGLTERDLDVLSLMERTPTLLTIGTIEPRKGHADILDAFAVQADLPEAWSLVIVGRAGWKTEEIQKRLEQISSQRGNIVWLDHATDEMLESLYKSAKGVIAASYDEGFGLPIIEALANNLPVLARDIPVFNEFSCSGVQFFRSISATELAGVIKEFLDHPPEVDAESLLARATWSYSAKDVASLLGLGPSSAESAFVELSGSPSHL